MIGEFIWYFMICIIIPDFRTKKPGYFNIDGEIYKHNGRIQFTRAKNQMQLVGCRDLDEQTSSSSKGAAASQLRKRG